MLHLVVCLISQFGKFPSFPFSFIILTFLKNMATVYTVSQYGMSDVSSWLDSSYALFFFFCLNTTELMLCSQCLKSYIICPSTGDHFLNLVKFHFFFLRWNLQHKINHFKVFNSVVFSAFTVFFHHHFYLVPKHFHHLKRKLQMY